MHPEAFYGGGGLWLTMAINILTGGLEHLWSKVKEYLTNKFGTGTYANSGIITVNSDAEIDVGMPFGGTACIRFSAQYSSI